MKNLSPLAAFVLVSACIPAIAQTTATTDPVGYYKVTLNALSDNYISIPMSRDAVFAGTVSGGIAASSFNVNAGSGSPNWTASQFVYANPAQRETYYAEITSGALRGLFYKVTANGTGSLTVDTQGDDLTNHPMSGAPAALAIGDGVKIRPYWRIKDVFENPPGTPIIDPRPSALSVRDEIIIPNYTAVGKFKAPSYIISYITGTGWRVGNGTVDYADFVLEPNTTVTVKRRLNANVDLTNTGWVLMSRNANFIPGGSASTENDTYFSINRPAPVKLDDSGLRAAIQESLNTLSIKDKILSWNAGTGFNRPQNNTYYYLAGSGWRKQGSPATDIGQTVFLNPGEAYILRRAVNSPGKDWINDPNY